MDRALTLQDLEREILSARPGNNRRAELEDLKRRILKAPSVHEAEEILRQYNESQMNPAPKEDLQLEAAYGRAKVGIDAGVRLVDRFREKIGGVALQTADQISEHERVALNTLAGYLRSQAQSLMPSIEHNKLALSYCMAHLMLEELSELFQALSQGDEVEALDALADIEFVTKRWAKALDLPLGAAFVEVCRSNMTKSPQADDDPRLRSKGPDYQPPQLKRLIEDHRAVPF